MAKSLVGLVVFFGLIAGAYHLMLNNIDIHPELNPASHEMKEDTTVKVKEINKDYLLGNFDPADDSMFVEVDLAYTSKEKLYVRKEVNKAFIEMSEAAKKEGIHLVIISGTRSFRYQKMLWERKWTGARLVGGKNLANTISNPVERAIEILKYSAMPGTSRHHWGTDIDINSVNNSYFKQERGIKVYNWLKEHASEYGFCQTYTAFDSIRPHGYQEEKWHWSYFPLSEKYLASYNRQIKYEDIKGFKGDEAAEPIDVIKYYVNGIAACGR